MNVPSHILTFDSLTVEEIDALSASEVRQKERDCMEKNAWQVAQEVAAMVDDEPGPSVDFVKCYVTTCKKDQFFFKKKYVMQYTAAKTEAKRLQVPGCSHFKKIYSFTDTHFQIGEMFLEYQKGACEISSSKLCDFCKSSEKCCSQTERIPRPFPDYQSPGLHYLPVHMTPTVNRTIDDYLPQAQLRKAYQSGECSLEDLNSISKFAQEFVVSEECVKTYLEHLKLLELKKVKRKKERLEKSSVRAKMTYQDYDWVGMCNDGSLSKQTVAMLDKYIQYHHLKFHPLKKEKLIEVQRHIINNLTNSATQQEQFDSGNELEEAAFSSEDEDQDEAVDFVLAEIGSSSSEEEEESDENDYDNSSLTATSTRSGRRATCFLL